MALVAGVPWGSREVLAVPGGSGVARTRRTWGEPAEAERERAERDRNGGGGAHTPPWGGLPSHCSPRHPDTAGPVGEELRRSGAAQIRPSSTRPPGLRSGKR